MSEITLGIIGSGQLGSLLCQAAKKLTVKTVVASCLDAIDFHLVGVVLPGLDQTIPHSQHLAIRGDPTFNNFLLFFNKYIAL